MSSPWPRSGPSERLKDACPAAALGALTFVVYLRVFRHKFLLNWDDITYVVENELVRGLSWEHVHSVFSRFYFGNYTPLHLASYAADYSLWGLDPSGFLLTNVLLHAANGCLFYWLLLRVGLSRWGAAFAAAVFLAHPVQVESVAWISERKNLLSMFFSLVALQAFVTYRALGNGRHWLAYAGAFVGTAAALLTKAIAIVLPPMFALFDLCYVEPPKRRHLIADKIPFFMAAAALVWVTLEGQKQAIAEGQAVFSMGRLTTLYTMVPVAARYLGMVFWPMNLSGVYAPAVRRSPDLTFWASALVLSGLVILAAFLFARRRQWFFWYAVFFVGLLPVLQIVPLPTLMNDRYLYFPMLGASALGGLAVDDLATRGRAVRGTVMATGGAAIAALATGSFFRTAVWQDDVTFWRDVTEKTPEATLSWVGLGRSLLDAGKPIEAIQAYQRAVAEDPFYALALNNLGSAYNQVGRPDSGRPFLLRAVQVDPDYFDAYMNLGIGYRMSGDFPGAERAFVAALSVRPAAPDALAALREVQRASRR